MQKYIWKTLIRGALVLILSLAVVHFDKSLNKDISADVAITQMSNSDTPIYTLDQISTWRRISPLVIGLGVVAGLIWAVQPVRKEMNK